MILLFRREKMRNHTFLASNHDTWIYLKLPTFEEVAKLSIQAQRRARTQTEKEMKVELQKYLAADNPQFHVIYASAQFYLGQAISDFWVAMAYNPRLANIYQEAQERIQKASKP